MNEIYEDAEKKVLLEEQEELNKDIKKTKELTNELKNTLNTAKSPNKLSVSDLTNPVKGVLGKTKVGKAISAARTISLISGGWIFIVVGIIILILIFFSYVANKSNQLDLFILCKGTIDNNCIAEAFKKSAENSESRYSPSELE